MVNSSRFAFDPRIDKPWGNTLREKLPRSVRLRYVNWGSKECQHLHAIGSRPEFGGDPNSPVLAPLIQTFCFSANPLKDWQLLPLQPWICPSWEPSQRHEFRLGGYERGYGWHWEWTSVDLNLSAARSSKGKTLTSYETDLYGFWWQFCEYLGDQCILLFSGKLTLLILPRVFFDS